MLYVLHSLSLVKVRFHHHIFPTDLMTNSLTKLPYKQISYIFVLFVSQKFVAHHIGLLYKLTKAILRASLSSSLLQKSNGGNAPLVTISIIKSGFLSVNKFCHHKNKQNTTLQLQNLHLYISHVRPLKRPILPSVDYVDARTDY
jgi:hypothetical protein